MRAMFGAQSAIAGVGGWAATIGAAAAVVVVVVAGLPAEAPVVVAAGPVVGLPTVAPPVVVAAGLPAEAPVVVVAGAEVGGVAGLPTVAAPVVVGGAAEVGSFEYSRKANVNDCSGPSFVSLTFITIVVGASLDGGFTFFRSASSVLPSLAGRNGNDSSSLLVFAA